MAKFRLSEYRPVQGETGEVHDVPMPVLEFEIPDVVTLDFTEDLAYFRDRLYAALAYGDRNKDVASCDAFIAALGSFDERKVILPEKDEEVLKVCLPRAG